MRLPGTRGDADQVAGPRRLGLGDADDLAGLGALDSRRGAALKREQRTRAHRLAIAADQLGAFGQPVAEYARDRQPADRAAVRDLEDLHRRALDPDPRRRLLGGRRVMAQHLEQPPDTEAVERRAEQHWYDQPGRRLPRQVAEDRVEARHLVRQQLFEQRIVMVGKLLEHMEARRRLVLLEMRGEGHLLGALAWLVMISPLQREVDKAGGPFPGADRDLARDQSRRAHRLQRCEQILDAAARLVDLVDEQRMGQADRLQPPQGRLDQRRARRIGIDHDEGEIGRGQRHLHVGRKGRGAGRVGDQVAVAHPVEAQQVELGRSAARPRLGTGIADATAGIDRTQSGDGAGRVQQGFSKTGLARACGANKRDRSRASADLVHARSPRTCRPFVSEAGRRDSGGSRLYRPERKCRAGDDSFRSPATPARPAGHPRHSRLAAPAAAPVGQPRRRRAGSTWRTARHRPAQPGRW